MRKTFDPRGQAETRAGEQNHTRFSNTIGKLDHRRTRRARVRIPLLVYGYGPQDVPFSEEAYTIEINAQGALIALETAVSLGERLLLINETNQRSENCKILSVATRQGRHVEVAVAFDTAAPQFWLRSSQNPKGVAAASR